MNDPRKGRRQDLEIGQPCGPGCASHITKRCENCGRVAAGYLLEPIEPIVLPPPRICSKCGVRPAMTEYRPDAIICATCFLRALDLMFYEMDLADERLGRPSWRDSVD